MCRMLGITAFERPSNWALLMCLVVMQVVSANNAGPFLNRGQADEPLVEFWAKGSLAGTCRDRSGLQGTLETQTPSNQLGGFSAIEYTGHQDRYIVLSDRGPGDGAASFACRYHQVDLHIDHVRRQIAARLIDTVLLKSASGVSLSGALTALENPLQPDGLLALDSEGIRLMNDGSLAISDEYGPSISSFEATGRRIAQWKLPSEFVLSSDPHAAGAMGAYPNRGLEGLAKLPGGTVLVAAMQGPLIQDGVIEGDKCLGIHTRWIHLDTQTHQTKQWVYCLADESCGVSEILAVDEDRFLVLERDSKGGKEAKFKRIYLADAREATDVSNVSRLGRSELPKNVHPVKKELLVDLLDDRWGLGGSSAAEKPEGLTWGKRLSDGRRLLIVCIDNDFESDRASEFYAFAIAI
jgi:hypothetical protein